jgi:hypothetical protein
MASINETDYALEDQTYAAIGAAIEVLNQLGHRIHEKPFVRRGPAKPPQHILPITPRGFLPTNLSA